MRRILPVLAVVFVLILWWRILPAVAALRPFVLLIMHQVLLNSSMNEVWGIWTFTQSTRIVECRTTLSESISPRFRKLGTGSSRQEKQPGTCIRPGFWSSFLRHLAPLELKKNTLIQGPCLKVRCSCQGEIGWLRKQVEIRTTCVVMQGVFCGTLCTCIEAFRWVSVVLWGVFVGNYVNCRYPRSLAPPSARRDVLPVDAGPVPNPVVSCWHQTINRSGDYI